MISKGNWGRGDILGMIWFCVLPSWRGSELPLAYCSSDSFAEWLEGQVGQTATLAACIWQTWGIKGTPNSYMVSGKQHLGELCIGTRFLYHMGKISTLTSGLWGDKKKTHPLPIPHIGRSGLRMSDCLRSCPISSTCVLEEGFPGGAHAKEHACQCRRLKTRRFNPLVRKIPWRRACQPTPVFLLRAFHG